MVVCQGSLHHRLIPHVTPDALSYPFLALEELSLELMLVCRCASLSGLL